MNTEPQTRVVFRYWNRAAVLGVIALFPDYEAGTQGCDVVSYEHCGQHGGANYRGVIEMTRPATPAEYAPLARELTQIGYNLKIAKRR